MKRTLNTLLIVIAVVYAQTVSNSTLTPAPSNSTTATTTTTTSGPSPTANPKWIFGGLMQPLNVVPPVKNSSASGILIAFWDGTSKLNYYIMHNVANPTAVRLHSGANFTGNAPVISEASSSSANTMITGTWTLQPEQVGYLFDNMMYLDVTSSAFPNGEIRTTLTLAPFSFQYIALLNFQQTTQQGLSPSYAQGLMIAGGGYNQTSKYFSAYVQHNITNTIQAAGIRGPAGTCATSSDVIFNFPSNVIANNNFMSYQFSTAVPSDYTNMNQGQYYIEIITDKYSNGEIRGQIEPPSYYTSSPSLVGFGDTTCQKLNITTTSAPARNFATNLATSILVTMCIAFLGVLLSC
jgi:hypothetical protein